MKRIVCNSFIFGTFFSPKTAKKEVIPGGKSEGKEPSDFDKKQLEMGIEVELEHTDDKEVAQEIAMDHLTEFPDYYTALKKMEKELKNEDEDEDEIKKEASSPFYSIDYNDEISSLFVIFRKGEIKYEYKQVSPFIAKKIAKLQRSNRPDKNKRISEIISNLAKTGEVVKWYPQKSRSQKEKQLHLFSSNWYKKPHNMG